MKFENHPPNDTEIKHEMEKDGYDSLRPVIEPEKLKELCEDDPLLMRCYDDMIKYCNLYARDVFNMMHEQKQLEALRKKGDDTQEAFEELKVLDRNRRNLHEALIGSVNMLSRELAKKEKDNEWMRTIVAEGRAGYATFALLTFYRIHSKIE